MLDTLLNDGWNYHDGESERLAVELEQASRRLRIATSTRC